MDKKIIMYMLIITALLLIPFVTAADFTFKQHDGVDVKIPCFDTDNAFCDTDINCTITINDPSGINVINNERMTQNAAFYNYTLNSSHTDTTGVYYIIMQCMSSTTDGFDSFTLEITSSGKEQKTSTAGIAIVLFILFITLFLLFIGFKDRLTNSILIDLVVKRSCFVLAIYMMILNTTIVATIAGASNLDVTREMFMYVSIFGYIGYASMVYLIFKTVIDYLKVLNEIKQQDRGLDYN